MGSTRRGRAAIGLAVTLGSAVGSGTVAGGEPDHNCLQVDLLVPVTTTLVGACAPHEPLTHECGTTPVGVLLVTECVELPVSAPATLRARR